MKNSLEFIIKKTFLILIIFNYSALLFAQTNLADSSIQRHYANKIELINLKNHIELLTSSSFEGRATGEKGQKMAGIYIQDFFIKNNLEPSVPTEIGKRYLQRFEIESQQLKKVVLTTESHTFMHQEDFLANPLTYIQNQKNINVLLMGDEILPNEQLLGRGVALFLPKNQEQKVFFPDSVMEKQQLLAQNAGAKALFWILDENEFKQNKNYLEKSKYLNQSEHFYIKHDKNLAVYFLSEEIALQLFELSEDELKALKTNFEENNIPAQFPHARLTIEVESKIRRTLSTENVAGFVEGGAFKDEVIVISAHYDHIGLHDGQVFAGADDNASGTAALMEIARIFALAKEDGFVPKRSILFLATSAEELGMLGSAYYSDFSPLFPIKNTVTNLNIDMIGREYMPKSKFPKNDYVSIVGSDWLSKNLHTTNEKANQLFTKLNLDYTYNKKDHPDQFFYRSDQYNFAKYAIPVIFYTSPDHKDYHKYTDTADKIDYERVRKVAQLIFHTTWMLANQDVHSTDVER